MTLLVQKSEAIRATLTAGGAGLAWLHVGIKDQVLPWQNWLLTPRVGFGALSRVEGAS